MNVYAIAGATGLPVTVVAADLADHADPDLPGEVDDRAGREYVRQVRRSQARHEALVAEYEAARAAWGEQRARVFHEAREEAARKCGRELRAQSVTGRRRKEMAWRMALLPATQAAEEWERAHPFPPFETWAKSSEGRAAASRVERALEREAVPA